MSIVSKNIKFLRRQNGFTQDAFSNKIGIKRSLLGAYEEARAKPNYENLFIIAKEFNISVESLLNEDLVENTFTAKNFSFNKKTSLNIDADLDNQLNFQNNSQIITKELPTQQIDSFKAENKIIEKIEWPIEKKELPSESFNKAMQLAIGVPYIETNEIVNYTLNFKNNKYLNDLPKISIPNFSGLNFRSFSVGKDFPIENSIFIGELVDFQNITNGNHYFLLINSGEILYRRVFDLTNQKGVFLLSSDKMEISSIEIPTKQVVEIFKLVAFVNYNEPMMYAHNNKVLSLLEELNKEIRKS